MAIRATISIELLQASVSAARTTTSVTYELSHATGIWTDPDSKNRVLKDEFPLSDVRFNLVEKNLTDSVPLVDVSAYDFSALKEDSFTFADTFTKVVAYHRSFTDAFTLDDLSQIDKDFYGNKGNIFTFADIIGLTYNKVFTDSYTVGDVFVRVVSYARDFVEVVGLVEAQATAVSKVETDTFTFDDVPSVGFSPYKEDTFTVGDTSFNSLIKNLVDAFTLDDSALVNKDFFGSKGNVLGFSEIFVRAVDFIREYTDSVAILDSPSVEPLYRKRTVFLFQK